MIFTDGLRLESPDRPVSDYVASFGAQIGATAAEALSDSPTAQLLGVAELDRARGVDYSRFSGVDDAATFGGPQAPAERPSVPSLSRADAVERVKQAGLEQHLSLPAGETVAAPVLDIMIDRARARAEREATIARGPQNIFAAGAGLGTSFLVGAIDPINIGASFIPVMGELRYGKLLASAGESAIARAGVRAGVGAAQGVVGQAALEPLDWYSHTQEGRDFGMADVLHNLVFGAALGGALHAGGGAFSDVVRRRQERPVYPYDLGEPLEYHTPWEELRAGPVAPKPLLGEFPGLDAEATLRPAAPIEILQDLPPRAQEDSMRAALASIIDGEPVKVGQILAAAASSDPRIAESLNLEKPELTDRGAVYDDVYRQLMSAGVPEQEARHNATVVAARYATRADRLGADAGAPADLYRAEGIDIRRGDELAATGAQSEERQRAQLFQFAGIKARTADVGRLDEVGAMMAHGASREEIFKRTGWYRDVDGHWKFYLSDARTRLRRSAQSDDPDFMKLGHGESARLDQVLDAPDLFAAYPHLREVRVFRQNFHGEKGGHWDQLRDLIGVEYTSNEHQTLSTLVHEIQHAIQHFEKFAPGSNPGVVGRDAYMRSAGEVEARNAETWARSARNGVPGRKILSRRDALERLDEAQKAKAPKALIAQLKVELKIATEQEEAMGTIAGVNFVGSRELQERLLAARKAGATKEMLQNMVDEYQRSKLAVDMFPWATRDTPENEILAPFEERSAAHPPEPGVGPRPDEPRDVRPSPREILTRFSFKHREPMVYEEGVSRLYDASGNKQRMLRELDKEIAAEEDHPRNRTRLQLVKVRDYVAEAVHDAGTAAQQFFQSGESPRGRITLSENKAIIDLFKGADQSTFMHEAGHLWLDELMRDAAHERASPQLRADRETVLDWLGVKDASEIGVEQHEKWARGFEGYLATGRAPSSILAEAFEAFRRWLAEIYRSLAGHGQEISPEIRGVMDRMFATDAEIAERHGASPRMQTAITINGVTHQVDYRQTADAGAPSQDDWRDLMQRADEVDHPDVLEASREADAMPEPIKPKLSERVAAAEQADANSAELYKMFADSLSEEERTRLDDALKAIDDEHKLDSDVIERAAACAFRARA